MGPAVNRTMKRTESGRALVAHPSSFPIEDVSRAYPVVISSEGINCYSAIVPDLPGCRSWGETREEAREHIALAIELWIASALSDHAPIPAPGSALETVVIPDALWEMHGRDRFYAS